MFYTTHFRFYYRELKAFDLWCRVSTPIPENTPPVAAGNFIPTSGINVTGSAKIYLNGNQKKFFRKLPVVLIWKYTYQKNATPTDFVNLGNLTSSKVYAIPTQVNVSAYKYVLIYCQQYISCCSTISKLKSDLWKIYYRHWDIL
jgi:hypothetical protein